MNMREFQNLSIDDGSRHMSRREQGQTTLPSFDTIAAAAGRGEVPPVQRPQRDYHGLQTPQSSYYGHPMPAQQTYGRQHQVPDVGHRGYAHESIEVSTPSTTFSSPRFGHIDYDTISTSSSSRESSAYLRNSVLSTTGVTGRSTRAKRGSDSQGSGSDRSLKRPSTGSRVGKPTNTSWCADCECPLNDCRNPKVHAPKAKKIDKEKSARYDQAAILQIFEDTAELVLQCSASKSQQPGNKRKSGMTTDKKEVFVKEEIMLDTAIQTILKHCPERYQEFVQRSRDRVGRHLTNGSPAELPADHLLAGPSGEGLCVHLANRSKCEDVIACRKQRRGVNFEHNFARLQESAIETSHRRASASSRSKTSMPRKH